jgi:PhoPQ-activated pathogenicity-related protein
MAARFLSALLAVGFTLTVFPSNDIGPPPVTRWADEWRETALDEYVRTDDPHYAYVHYHTSSNFFLGTTTYFLEMTSQRWRSPSEVDRTLWDHYLRIVVPQTASGTTALQFVDGGSNNGEPNPADLTWEFLASQLGMVLAVVGQVPNQPLYFSDEVDRPRSEDAIIAYSFDRFLRTGDDLWPVLLPMTKAVVRSLDTVQSFLGQDLAEGDRIEILDFVVAGASKRGWTSYLTAAVDSRVIGLIPISIDILNAEPSLRHHWETYGFYAPAIGDYAAFDIFCRLPNEDPEGRLLDLVDPYSYRARLSMPKFVINSAGDQFFVPTSSRFYFGDLPDPKVLRYTVNTDHAQDPPTLAAGVVAWIESLREGEDLPEFDWSFEGEGVLRVTTSTAPENVRLWWVTNSNARDFRRETLRTDWTSTVVESSGAGIYTATVSPPQRGFTAYLMELDFGGGHVYTTEVGVVPDVLPFAGTHCAAARYFPQIADGRSGSVALRTEIALVNTGEDSLVRLEFFDTAGEPMEMELGDLGMESAFEIPLARGRSYSVTTPGTREGLQVGYARMSAGSGVGGTALFTRLDAPRDLVLTEAGVPATDVITSFSVLVDSMGDKDTGVAMVNPWEEEARVQLRLYDEEFELMATRELVLEPGEHRARFVFELFEHLGEQVGEMRGVLTVRSDRPLAALTLRTRDDPALVFPDRVPILTAFPVVPGVPD